MFKKLRMYILITAMFFISGCAIFEQNGQGVDEEQLTGNWSGAIQIPNEPLHIQISLSKEEEWTSQLSIPAQGVNKFSFETVKMKPSNMVFKTNLGGQEITFKGEFADDEISGTFHQAGQSFPFKLIKSIAKSDGEFLSIETDDDDTLQGELALPEADEPYPIALIIPGSGPTDRNGNTLLGENNSLRFLAEKLAENGVASLRFDKRGAGKNASAIGDGAEFQFDQYVKDAVDWVELLKSDERFSNISIIGHSEGSLVGMLAGQETDIHTLVSIAGAGRSTDEILYDQIKEQTPERLHAESKEILQQIKEGDIVEDVPTELMGVFPEANQPFLSSWMQYDPAEEISELSVPILLVNGDNDLQVPPAEAEILNDASTTSELLIIEEMNHILKESPTDRQENLATYSHPRLPLADGLMDGIVDFFDTTNFSE